MSIAPRIVERRYGPRRAESSPPAREESWFGDLGPAGDAEIQGRRFALRRGLARHRAGAGRLATVVAASGRRPRRGRDDVRAHLPRLHRRARGARRRAGRHARRRRRLRPAPDAGGRVGQRRLRGAGHQHVAAAALPAAAAAAGAGAPAQPAVARDDRRRPDLLHRAASAGAGSSLNYEALLVLPVLMAGILTPRLLALATAAAVTLILLGTAWLGLPSGGDATLLMTQAGLAGSGFFVITVLAGELAPAPRARGDDGARQPGDGAPAGAAEPARDRGDAGRRARRRPARPGARRQPGGAAPARAQRHEPARAVPAARRAGLGGARRDRGAGLQRSGWPAAGRDVVLQFEEHLHRTLRARIRFTRRREPQASEEFCVLFLEDVRNMQARSRQEKLAAMGRVSAGIAHEIRNPLAAISQANALLVRRRHRPGAAPADAHGDRQRRAPEAHRRRRDGGGARRGPGRRRDRCHRAGRRGLRRVGARGTACSSASRACCGSICRPSRSACCSTPSTCAACS